MSGPLFLQFGLGDHANLPIPSTFEFGIIHNTQIHTSPLNQQTQTIEIPGARWKVRMAWEDLTQADIRHLKAFMVELRGMANRFSMYDLSLPTPQQAVAGTLSIVPTPSDSNQIEITGMTGSDFSPGDMISITNVADPGGADDLELKMITKIVVPMGGGSTTTVNIEPGLRRRTFDVYDNAPIAYDKAYGHFMLSSDTQTNWVTSGKVPLSSLELEGIEVFAYG